MGGCGSAAWLLVTAGFSGAAGAGTGTGFSLATEQRLPAALLDVSIERAGRDGFESDLLPDGLRERFWRMNISLSVFGR